MQSNEQYIESFTRFYRKFNCAANQLKVKCIKITPGENYIEVVRGKWKIKEGKNDPLSVMMDGKRVMWPYFYQDVGYYYNLSENILDTFSQGFRNNSAYKDLWKDSSIWVRSISFNLGRYCLRKYCNVNLPCDFARRPEFLNEIKAQ